MAVRIAALTNDADQQHTLLTDSGTVRLRLRFHPVAQIWTMDVEYGDDAVYGVRLAAGTRHVQGARWPFDFYVRETLGSGVCPYKADDWSSGRCELWFVTAAEMEEIRGVEVPLAGEA